MKEIEAWLRATKMSEARLGLLACANPRAIARIRLGTAKLNTLSAVLAYVRANPPSKRR